MRVRRSVSYPIYPVLLAALAPGCQVFHDYRPAPIQVLDAETNKPIAGAQVRLSYPTLHPNYAPWTSAGQTDSDGIVTLRAACVPTSITMVEATAPGFMLESKELPAKMVQSLRTDKRPACLVLALYAEPRPAVELVVPAGYRGLVKADVQIPEDGPVAPGQRTFRYEVAPSGAVLVTGPPVLRRVLPQSFELTYADGVPLGRQAKQAELGYWWLKSEGDVQYFLVGTQQEFDNYRRVSTREERAISSPRRRQN